MVIQIGIHIPGLGLVQTEVGSLPLHQFIMAARLDDFPPVHHHQPVGFVQGGQTVGDRDRGAAAHQVVQCLLNFLFGLGIDGRGRFIEDQDARIDQQRARNRDTLAFSAGQTLAAFAHQRVVTVRQAQDEFMGVRGACGGDDLRRVASGLP